jgi:CheY-like chemotaxis protein
MVRFEKVLLVDDDEDDREFMLQVLGDSFPDVACTIAVNGRDALKQLEGYRPDIIFLDLNMPLMDGRQFLRLVKQRADLAEIPIVILSTSSDIETITETRSLGAKDFITKPDKLSDWVGLVERIFQPPAKS